MINPLSFFGAEKYVSDWSLFAKEELPKVVDKVAEKAKVLAEKMPEEAHTNPFAVTNFSMLEKQPLKDLFQKSVEEGILPPEIYL